MKVCLQQAIEEVESGGHPIKSMLQAATNGLLPESQPIVKHLFEVVHARPTIQPDHVHIHAVTVFEIRRRKKMLHKLGQLNPI
jgi:hypothetical protein